MLYVAVKQNILILINFNIILTFEKVSSLNQNSFKKFNKIYKTFELLITITAFNLYRLDKKTPYFLWFFMIYKFFRLKMSYFLFFNIRI